jgi:hypothetical protein
MVAGLPTVAGAYFDPALSEVDTNVSPNFQISPVRNGTAVMLQDPAAMVPTGGSLITGRGTVDQASGAAYLGTIRYLGSCLAYHFRNHLPIAIFKESSFGTGEKAWVAYLTSLDDAIEAASIDDDSVQIFLSRINQIDSLKFGLFITRDGIYTDRDDIASAIWNAR